MWLFKAITWYITKVKKKKIRKPPIRSSKGERKVEKIFRKHKFNYELQYRIGYIHADFAVFLNNKTYIIEYDGRQHYHPVSYFGGIPAFIKQRIRDILEKYECKSQNMPLLRIKYNVPLRDIEKLIIKFLK